ncbi:hypothetical protein [Gangjinia marincola]
MLEKKYTKLFIGLILDAIGMLSFTIPFVGELSDIIWAPISAWAMTKLYKGKVGSIASKIAFVEEALPGLDIIPTFTITWLYMYVFAKEKPKEIIVG